MICAVGGSGPHSQDGESARPHKNILLLKLPAQVRRGLSFTQSFWGSSDPDGALVFGETVNWSGLEFPPNCYSLQTARRLELES